VTNDNTRPPHQSPDVEIDIGGTWHPGHLVGWTARPDGLWADVAYVADTTNPRSSTFPAERVRPVIEQGP